VDVDLFQKSPFGKLVPISGSLAGRASWDHWAFLPNLLADESPELSCISMLMQTARVILIATDVGD
jgi:hypothetical protein